MSDFDTLREKANETRIKFLNRLISEKEALDELKNYIDVYNKKAVEIADKYGMRPQKLSARKYLRFKTDLRKR